MPICQHCGEKWSWSQTLRRMFTTDTVLTCAYCGSKQYLTRKSRRRSILCVFIVMFPMLLPIFTDISPIITLILLVVMYMVVVAVFPFFITLSNEEEPIF
ncbi:TIGR04104 family putative zinc finger protein [Oceanobacillus halotolerans]|uniref:TIGR04104 family putative zinc finger protein n=1 Tax=Oceanobacillus halotolerans TaxID=2663380 RepID=UPI0013DCE906|nr:TIGR04104 family putative zinc finger protein [Oceanobacillus halotolerans]